MITKRIEYYTRKVAEFGAVHPSQRKNQYRYNRLMNYKRAMHKRIEVEIRRVD